MKAPQGEWRTGTARHNTGEEYWLGEYRVGAAFYALRSRGEPAAYRATVELPGIKVAEAKALQPTIGEARALVERVVALWFSRLETTPALPDKQVGMEPSKTAE